MQEARLGLAGKSKQDTKGRRRRLEEEGKKGWHWTLFGSSSISMLQGYVQSEGGQITIGNL
jgi:hypothetical protein